MLIFKLLLYYQLQLSTFHLSYGFISRNCQPKSGQSWGQAVKNKFSWVTKTWKKFQSHRVLPSSPPELSEKTRWAQNKHQLSLDFNITKHTWMKKILGFPARVGHFSAVKFFQSIDVSTLPSYTQINSRLFHSFSPPWLISMTANASCWLWSLSATENTEVL